MNDYEKEARGWQKPPCKTIDLRPRLEALFSSPVWSEIRGSIGGTTYSRVRAGAIARNRTKPVNPNTANQSLVRSRVGALSDSFGGLTPAQINAWEQFVQGYPFKNKLGEEYIGTAKQMYFVCNLNLLSIGLASIAQPPYEVPVVPGVDIEAATLSAEVASTTDVLTDLTIDAVTSDYAGDFTIVVQVTPNLQPSRANYKNKYRQIFINSGNIAAEAILAPWNSYFGTPVVSEGQIIKARVAVVADDSGISSSWFYLPPALAFVAP